MGVLIAIITYLALLMFISFLTGRDKSDKTYFLGNKQSPWMVVAVGMVGSSVSGISLVSVPGMVMGAGFSYLQMCLGFVVGYAVVALVLLPLYYKLNLTSIYGYLQTRFGTQAQRTGAWFFIVSKAVTSASKLYVAALVLQTFVFAAWGVPLWLTVSACVLMIWLYTFRSGIGTIVWTDALQTVVLFAAIILMLVQVTRMLDLSFADAVDTIKNSPLSNTFVFSDWMSSRNFFKQFAGGVFIVIVMTGLNQDMMQTTLSCRNLRQAQKNMLCYGTAFVPFNLLLLSLGVLLVVFAQKNGIALPEKPDEIVPMFAAGILGKVVYMCFIFGIIAATFNSADSALTAIVTSVYVDILSPPSPPAPRRGESLTATSFDASATPPFGGRGGLTALSALVCVAFVLIVLLFANIENRSILDTIYTIVSYAYGPLLGLFAFGLLTKRRANDRAIPYIAIASPVLTYAIDASCRYFFQYQFGYELLVLNGGITFAGLYFFNCKW